MGEQATRRHGERLGIVWNPSKVEEAALRVALAAAVDQTGVELQSVHWFTTTPEDAGQGAAEAAMLDGCTIVAAAGGDGTVRAVAERLAGAARADTDRSTGADEGTAATRDDDHAPPDLGIVPLGTGNLLARNLGVPLGSPRAALARLLLGPARPLDVGEVRVRLADGRDERHGFVVMIGFGIDAQMIAETDEKLKSRAGWLAYVESLGRALSGSEMVDFEISLDGEPERSDTGHTLLIANCGSLQGGLTLLPAAAPDDGELDLLLLRADGMSAWLDTMRNLVWDNGIKRRVAGAGSGSAESTASADHLRARSVRVRLPKPLPFEVDGEHLGEVDAFSVRVIPGAIAVR